MTDVEGMCTEIHDQIEVMRALKRRIRQLGDKDGVEGMRETLATLQHLQVIRFYNHFTLIGIFVIIVKLITSLLEPEVTEI